jgi:hypothetical protein
MRYYLWFKLKLKDGFCVEEGTYFFHCKPNKVYTFISRLKAKPLFLALLHKPFLYLLTYKKFMNIVLHMFVELRVHDPRVTLDSNLCLWSLKSSSWLASCWVGILGPSILKGATPSAIFQANHYAMCPYEPLLFSKL